MNIPLNDLARHLQPFTAPLQEAFSQVMSGGQWILGSWCEQFENSFADYCGTRHAISLANGTQALELALQALGCQRGDEIVTVANAGGYASQAILRAGAIPVYADVDAHHFLITPESFAASITPRTKAVVITHLYGLMADMPALCDIAHARGIAVVEDCAQAHGASFSGCKAGSWGLLGCFSFYPTKNLGALGDAGCITTSDAQLAATLLSLRQHGWRHKKYHCQDLGQNSRMDALQAAFLLCLLPHLDGWNHKRRSVIAAYRQALTPLGALFQQAPDDERFVAHLCTLRVKHRDALRTQLHKAGIATDIHYPVLDYAQPAFLQNTTRLPVSEQLAPEILSIPCFPEMTQEDIAAVVRALTATLEYIKSN